MILPDMLHRQRASDTSLLLTLRLPADLFWFKGHFPSSPILPGVTQVNWVMGYAEELLSLDKAFSGMEVVKFQRPLLPEEIVNLQIDWLKEKQRLVFRYSVGQAIASSGKITLCP
ncbi:hydroxymyristoyl-ACP dehydratase [Rahnella sp. C60]|jgi:3-hydroxymyristoyl/3-hydroxydecanoyl-(acyl carrier protein) dehydratase|uniref:ApeI family dehydratase n=1 Tax=Rahnella TaxID=34037 RepID=UPI00101F99F9|nr:MULTISPECIES: hydroxymyristoyl-ACP dehydratase [Rahnella]MBU9814369.1 hydroxymyristoyl-ACP dehydratase [Rahnella perminowiae]MCR9002794.1 hydroxymyristoyl-ACP dehydratase [Rahnella perminowiae]MCX2944013.1 hydroxymyristoyl-ACP dehydratase [Rahnella perminowiae]